MCGTFLFVVLVPEIAFLHVTKPKRLVEKVLWVTFFFLREEKKYVGEKKNTWRKKKIRGGKKKYTGRKKYVGNFSVKIAPVCQIGQVDGHRCKLGRQYI